MAIFGTGWIGSLFLRDGGTASKLTETANSQPDARTPVTPNKALQLGTVWACVRLLSETIGTLPFALYQKGTDGQRSAYPDHGLYALIHDSPNADQSAAEFWEAVVAGLCLWGNSYAEIVRRTKTGDIVALNFLKPWMMKPGRDASGARIYKYTEGGKVRTYQETEIFHVRGFGIGLDEGLSPISYARKTLGLAIDTDDAAGNAFRNSSRPSGFLVVPKGATPEQKNDLRRTFIDPITGANNTAKAGILEHGMDWREAKGLPPEDLQLIEGRAFNVEEICRWFRVPPFMVGHTEKTSSWGTGLEQQMIAFLTFALRPYLTRIEQAVKKQLLKPVERKSVYAEFNLEGLLRADSAGRAALANAYAQNGINTRNEIRARDNLPPLPGGEILTVQSNMIPLDRIGEITSVSDVQARQAMTDWLGIEGIIEKAIKSALIGHNGGPKLENDQ